MTRLLHRSVGTKPFVAVDAKGLIIRSSDGREIIDGSGGAAVACLGHGHTRVLDAIREQLGRVTYAHTGFYTTSAAEDLAELLVGHEPGGLSQAYFVSSGSEATEAALKMARQYALEIGEPGRDWFISRRHSYHGNTLGALAVSGNMVRRPPYAAVLSSKVSHVSPCFPYRGQQEGESGEAYVARLAAELEAEFQRVGPQRVIAFVAEPVVGATIGCVPALPGYFKAVREICDRHGALLILDEVMCGMGRTGTTHAWEQEGVSPDIQVIAKGLGGGYQPIGGILIHRRVIEALRRGTGLHRHGHTYSAHPVACAAALAVQRVIAEENLIENVRARGDQLGQMLRACFGDHPHVGDIRGRGLFWALEFVFDRNSKQPFAPELDVNTRIKAAAFDAGLACYPSGGTVDGKQGDHVLLAPPYTATKQDIDVVVERFEVGVQMALPS
jgi:adenosylmethionine-8-amino-7-oxononanoate aminotransferase